MNIMEQTNEIKMERLNKENYKDVLFVENQAFSEIMAEDKKELTPVMKYPGTGGLLLKEGVIPIGYVIGGRQGVFESIEDQVYKDEYYGIKRGSEIDSRDNFYLHGIAVSPKHQGSGHGDTMMRKIIDEARENGYQKLTFSVYGQNNMGFFNKYGAKIEEKMPGWHDDGEDNIYCSIKL